MSLKEKDIKLVIGSGGYNNNPGWLHTQENELSLLDEKTWGKMFDNNSVAVILAEHVWEHLTYYEGVQAAKVCHKFLKPGGYIRCAVPDAFFQDEEYQNTVKTGGPGPKDHPAADHKIVYNYKSITDMFHTAGFETQLLEYFDEKGAYHQNFWDGKDGVIFRSKKYDPRNQGQQIIFPSLIVDAVKI
ncbi:SAM-dependent methyltransferase [Virgibacillus halodenitrificans]|uniref:class I SAM-dependent methyltransferase n=1 Tax=Virgibacillus halodenitrificans TaxID=1482 RepID=UPI00136EE6C7|nr:SAM-dependent methyltransferase [Virgibacillus halodenitrificans]MYL46405.1 SAM-dependent methyltransferase [Virgibacillus halodenitrificans]